MTSRVSAHVTSRRLPRAGGGQREREYSRDMVRGNSREGGGVYSRDMCRGNSREWGGGGAGRRRAPQVVPRGDAALGHPDHALPCEMADKA